VKSRTTATILIAALVLAACSSDSDSAATTVGEVATTTTTTTLVSVPTSTTTTTTTEPSSTTTSAEATTSTSTTIPADPVMPLTGLPIEDPALAARSALVVKIDNHGEARPQSGLNKADIVFEENVEHLTRFAAVFQTQAPDPVGPIRSGRTQDVQLLGSLNKPIFAWSGGNPGVTEAINGSDFIVANVQTKARKASESYRSRDRSAPHNLYAQGTGLFTLSPAVPSPPPQQFHYRKAGAPVAGVDSGGVEVAMDGVSVDWKFDAKTGTYLRFQGGKAHTDAALGQIVSTNVVVLVVDYQPSPVDYKSPEAQTIGTGEVYVFSGGKVLHGKWTRADRLATYQLTADSGDPIELTPGRTWVELARVDSTELIPA
jgi:Protein of unknown function (DUF3048) N-terminal domain/Protein of unknown function (DUF3048) C-terminal domain